MRGSAQFQLAYQRFIEIADDEIGHGVFSKGAVNASTWLDAERASCARSAH
jgi:hypothetical protein